MANREKMIRIEMSWEDINNKMRCLGTWEKYQTARRLCKIFAVFASMALFGIYFKIGVYRDPIIGFSLAAILSSISLSCYWVECKEWTIARNKIIEESLVNTGKVNSLHSRRGLLAKKVKERR